MEKPNRNDMLTVAWFAYGHMGGERAPFYRNNFELYDQGRKHPIPYRREVDLYDKEDHEA